MANGWNWPDSPSRSARYRATVRARWSSFAATNTPAFVIGGDVLFAGSVGRTDLAYGDGPIAVRWYPGSRLFDLPDDTRGLTRVMDRQRRSAGNGGTNPYRRGSGLARIAWIDSVGWDRERFCMAVWAIADLHLSLARPDRRERYAARWRDHADPDRNPMARGGRSAMIWSCCRATCRWPAITATSSPTWPGSTACRGPKILSAGNHDAWWNERRRDPPHAPPLDAGGGGGCRHDPTAWSSAGRSAITRSSTPTRPPSPIRSSRPTANWPNWTGRSKHAARLRTIGEPLYVLWHYPPFDQHRRPGPCVARFEAAGVTAVRLRPHLHIQGQWSLAVQGDVRGVRYHCVAADAIGFRPLRLDRPSDRPRGDGR